MDRCAVLVDAGYLLAEGGKAYCGVRGRARVECDYTGVASALARHCGALVNLPVLRTYWYDAARDGIPTGDHLTVASAPRVKLRLGRLSGGRQKGVDSLIVHDLITLAHARAVCTMYLLGGDEDLREGVAAAQRLGVQVIVLGIDTGERNQALTLIHEADEHTLLPPDLLKAFFREHSPAPTGGQEPASAGGDVRGAAATFASHWALAAGDGRILELLAQAPVIPRELDAQLLQRAEAELGYSLRGATTQRHALRNAFWEALRQNRRPPEG